MRAANLCLCLVLALVPLVGCGTPTFVVQQYPGPARATETVAILRVDGSRNVQLLSLDGEATDVRLTPDSRLHIEVLPGNHTLWVVNLSRPENAARAVAFRAEPGRVYRVEFRSGAVASAESPRIYQVDRGSNVLGIDVTLPEPLPAARPAPPPTPSSTPPVRVIEEAAPASPPSHSDALVPGAEPAPPSDGAPVDAGAPVR